MFFFKLCVIQRQVPLSLPCVNFAQVTIPSLTHQKYTILAIFHALNKGVHNMLCIFRKKLLTLFVTKNKVSSRYNSSGVMGGVCKV